MSGTVLQAVKPLGHKSYGSIPHLPGSRLGPGEHCITEGQRVICEEKARNKHDVVIVQEKLDGSNVGVAKIRGEILALTRAGYLASTSPYRQHHAFAFWVAGKSRLFAEILEEGERICGEWLLQAHGTRYRLSHEPFVAFDIMRVQQRVTFGEFMRRVSGKLPVPHVIQVGRPLCIADAMSLLGPSGRHGAIDEVEGAVWRVERKGKVDFLAKYVRPDKEDGKYMFDEVWNDVAR